MKVRYSFHPRRNPRNDFILLSRFNLIFQTSENPTRYTRAYILQNFCSSRSIYHLMIVYDFQSEFRRLSRSNTARILSSTSRVRNSRPGSHLTKYILRSSIEIAIYHDQSYPSATTLFSRGEKSFGPMDLFDYIHVLEIYSVRWRRTCTPFHDVCLGIYLFKSFSVAERVTSRADGAWQPPAALSTRLLNRFGERSRARTGARKAFETLQRSASTTRRWRRLTTSVDRLEHRVALVAFI